MTEDQLQTLAEGGETSASSEYQENLDGGHNGGGENIHMNSQSMDGMQYSQSILQPDLLKSEEETLQVDETNAEGGTEQIFYSDGIPQNLGQGEKLYAVVDGVAYEIITGPDNGLIARPAPPGTFEGVVSQTDASGDGAEPPEVESGGISLEDLATISAERETLSLGEGDMGTVGDDHGMENQQYLEMQQDASAQDGGMQIAMMQEENQALASSAAAYQETIKVGDQDFVLQPGQQLPPELQDMVARGLPIDFSKYEFVIEDESGETQYLSGEAAGLQFATGEHNSQVHDAGAPHGVNPNDVLSMLAEASSTVAMQEKHLPAVNLPKAAPVAPNTQQRSTTESGGIMGNQWKPAAAASRQQSAIDVARKHASMFTNDENYDGEFNRLITTPEQVCFYEYDSFGPFRP